MKWLENTKSRRVYPEEHQVFHRDVPGAEESEAPDGDRPVNSIFAATYFRYPIQPSGSILGNHRVVLNIKGNKYRPIVAIRYDLNIVFIRFVGSHKEYDKVDGKTK